MVRKKEASAQAKGRAAKSQRESDAANKRMVNALEMNTVRGNGESQGPKPAAYGNEKTQKKQKPISRLQSKMYAEYKNPTNALAKNRSAKAKDSKPKKNK